eukprot:TRINITY_DN30297_c0_g1_i2.p1 TRINITY_DN30297_c0_g1~~TRINITY_DN30297_c0_g1_i2.p1  ORF type:complete len:224 (-),score=9.25 TRINITY_DN30297_c0_g1_i2:110-781(-)
MAGMTPLSQAADMEQAPKRSSLCQPQSKWGLLGYQTGLATSLYFASTWTRRFGTSSLSQAGLQLGAWPVVVGLYHVTSFNMAGNYYNTLLGQVTELPQHFRDIRERFRDYASYQAKIAKEREAGVFRATNALEAGVISVFFVMLPCLLLSHLVARLTEQDPNLLFSSLPWRGLETLMYFAWHGFVQLGTDALRPEAMWHTKGGDEEHGARGVEPFQKHPVPSY